MDRSTPLTVAVHAGGGHSGQGGHGHLELTADGKRVVDFARSRPDPENAAIIKAFMLDWTWTGITGDYNGKSLQGGNDPPRYDPHTGVYYVYGEDDSSGVVICTDPTLLLTKSAPPAGSRHGGQTKPGK